MLHTLSASADSSAFTDCLRLCAAGDALVLMGDGVYCALEHSSARQALMASDAAIFALRDDAVAAGIADRLNGIALIDITQLVELSEQHAQQQAWF